MKTKVCSRCTTRKPLDQYCKCSRMKDGLQSACKVCMNDSYNRSRQKNLSHYKRVQEKRRQASTTKFRLWKEQQYCCSCGERDPVCLDLHHLDPNEKDINISDAVTSWSWSRLLTEIEKCVVICSNCHRKVHAGKILLVDKIINIR